MAVDWDVCEAHGPAAAKRASKRAVLRNEANASFISAEE